MSEQIVAFIQERLEQAKKQEADLAKMLSRATASEEAATESKLQFAGGQKYALECLLSEPVMTTVPLDGVGKDLFIAQYEALRDEIHQRVDQRQQLLTFAMIGAASFFSIGLQSWVSGVTVLCYPMLAFFLACAWGQHDRKIREINQFLGGLEARYLEACNGWETYRRKTFKKKRTSFFDSVNFSARGLFAGSELLALVIGLARYASDPQMAVVFIGLILVDVAAIIATVCVLSRRRGLERRVQG